MRESLTRDSRVVGARGSCGSVSRGSRGDSLTDGPGLGSAEVVHVNIVFN